MAAQDHILNIRIQFSDSGKFKENIKEGADAANQFRDEVQEANNSMKSMMKISRDFREAWQDWDWGRPLESAMDVARALGRSLQRNLGWFGKAIFGVLAGVGTVFMTLLDDQEKLVDMFNQLQRNVIEGADTIGERVATSMRHITNITMKTGAAMQDVLDIYSSLALMRVDPSSWERLTELTVLSSQALGANVDQMSQFVGNLSVMGELSDTQIESMMTGFVGVQNAVGLTNKELTSMVDTLSTITMRMSSLGATAETIENIASEAATLTGIFASLGLRAERAGEIMGRLFDPSQLQQNVFLVQQMGMGMAKYRDMLAGGGFETGQITEGLIKASQKFADLPPFVAAKYADMMGITYDEMRRLGSATAEEQKQMIEDAKERANLQEAAAEGMSGLRKAWSRFTARIQATFGKILAPIFEKLTDVVNHMGELWLENKDKINSFINDAIDGFVKLIENIDTKKIQGFFERVFNFFKSVMSFFGKIGDFAEGNLLKIVGVLIGLKTVLGTTRLLFLRIAGIKFKDMKNNLGVVSGSVLNIAKNMNLFKKRSKETEGVLKKLAGVALQPFKLAGRGFSKLGEAAKSTSGKFKSLIGEKGIFGALGSSIKNVTSRLNPFKRASKEAASSAGKLVTALKDSSTTYRVASKEAISYTSKLGTVTSKATTSATSLAKATTGLGTATTKAATDSKALARATADLQTNMSGMGKAASGATKATSSLKSAFGAFAKMAGVAAIIAALGWGVHQLAKAMKIFNEVDFGSFMAGIAALLLLGGVAAALGLLATALTASGVIAAMWALVGVIVALSAGAYLLAKSFEIIVEASHRLMLLKEQAGGLAPTFAALGEAFVAFVNKLGEASAAGIVKTIALTNALRGISEAVNTLDPSNLKALSGAVSEDTVDTFKKLGGAMSEVVSSLNIWQTIGLKKKMAGFKMFAEGVKELAVAMWVLAQAGKQAKEGFDPLERGTEVIKEFGNMSKAVLENVGMFTGKLEALGSGFKGIAEGIKTLSALTKDEMQTIADSLKSLAAPIGAFLGALGIGAKTAIFQNLAKVGEGFKELSVGLWVLSKVDSTRIKKVLSNIVQISTVIEAMAVGALKKVKETGEGFKSVAEGINTLANIEKEKLAALSETLPNVSEDLGILLSSLKEGTKVIGNVKQTGEAFKELAIGVWALGQTEWSGLSTGLENSMPSIESLITTLKESTKVIGDIEKTAKAFKLVADSIGNFASLDSNNLTGTASAIETMGGSVNSWLISLGESAAAFKDVEAVGRSFKSLAEGLSLLAEARSTFGDFGALGDDMSEMTASLQSWSETLKGEGGFKVLGLQFGKSMEGVGLTFKNLGEGIKSLTEASTAPVVMSSISASIKEMAGALQVFGDMSKGLGKSPADKFIDFLNKVREAGPVQIDMETPEGETVGVGAEIENMDEMTALSASIQASFENAATRIVNAIDKLDTNENTRNEIVAGQLERIARQTKKRP